MVEADELQRYRGELQFEMGLLSARLNAFIASESFLVIAYATAMSALFQQPRARHILALSLGLALLGLVLALSAWSGIDAAHAIIQHWHLRQGELLARDPSKSARDTGYREALSSAMRVHGRGNLVSFRRGTRFARQAPWIFAVAWCLFAALSLWVSLHG